MHVVAPFLNVAVTGRSFLTTCRGCWGQPPGGWSAPSGATIIGGPSLIACGSLSSERGFRVTAALSARAAAVAAYFYGHYNLGT